MIDQGKRGVVSSGRSLLYVFLIRAIPKGTAISYPVGK